jgi:hypothetical protein
VTKSSPKPFSWSWKGMRQVIQTVKTETPYHARGAWVARPGRRSHLRSSLVTGHRAVSVLFRTNLPATLLRAPTAARDAGPPKGFSGLVCPRLSSTVEELEKMRKEWDRKPRQCANAPCIPSIPTPFSTTSRVSRRPSLSVSLCLLKMLPSMCPPSPSLNSRAPRR